MSARFGDNVTRRSAEMAWYTGPTLLEHLETVPLDGEAGDQPFRFPVQYVNRPNLDFRGFAGTVASGSIAKGDDVVVAKSGKLTRVKRIVAYGGDLARAAAGQAVTLVLEDEVELSRGNMLVSPYTRPHVADQVVRQSRLVRRGGAAARPHLHPAHRGRPSPARPCHELEYRIEHQRLRRGTCDHAQNE